VQRGRNLEVEAKSLSVSRPASNTHPSRSTSPDPTRNAPVTTGKECVEGIKKDVNLRRASLKIHILLDRLAYGVYLGVIVGTVDDFISPYNAIKDNRHHRIILTLEPIQDNVHDAVPYYHKKAE